MRSLAFALAFAFALSGCADLAGHAPSVVERCHASQSLLFREDSASGDRALAIPKAQSFATLLNNGLWTRASFNVSPENGTDNWGAPVRVLHNLTIEDVKVDFERGITSKRVHDVTVAYASRRTLTDAEFAAMCGTLADGFASVPVADEAAACSGDATTTSVWRAWLDGQETDRSAACGGAANATHAFTAAISAIEANDAKP